MDKLIYVAMSGAREAMRAQATTSHNLAKHHHGLPRRLAAFLASAVARRGLPTRVNATDSTRGLGSTTGATQATGRDLDVAVQGEGWLVVQGRDGNEAYTRNGDLRVNANGKLLQRRRAAGARQRRPGERPATSETDRRRRQDLDRAAGTDGRRPVQVDRLRLVNPPAEQLVRGGDGLFNLRDGSDAPADPTVRIASGALESSNVNPAERIARNDRDVAPLRDAGAGHEHG